MNAYNIRTHSKLTPSFPKDATTGATTDATANSAAAEDAVNNATVLTGTGRSAATASAVARLADAAVATGR
jgi:hypothetical protein